MTQTSGLAGSTASLLLPDFGSGAKKMRARDARVEKRTASISVAMSPAYVSSLVELCHHHAGLGLQNTAGPHRDVGC